MAQQRFASDVEARMSRSSSSDMSNPDIPVSPAAPSPSVDLHALFGIPRPKRPSEKSEGPEEVSESENETDSDEEEEDLQEGEYLVVEDNEEFREDHVTLMADQASIHRQILLRIFEACTPVYEKWMLENETSVPEAEAEQRRAQLVLYRKVLELYGGDTEWTSLTPHQRVSRDEEALLTSQKAKSLGQPPDTVTNASMLAAKAAGEDPADNGNLQDGTERILTL